MRALGNVSPSRCCIPPPNLLASLFAAAASMHGLRLPVAKLSRSLLLFLLIIALTYASLLTFQGLVAEKTRLEERLAALEDELARCRADGDACTVKCPARLPSPGVAREGTTGGPLMPTTWLT
eukprot:jgi/Mesvir1/4582/Mv08158-RA.1